MSSEIRIRRRDLRTCRKCGYVFHHVHGSCPQCGALRDHRRKRPSKELGDRIDYAFWRMRKFVRRYRQYLLYVGGGVFFALVIHPLILHIAARSQPEGSVDQVFDAYLAAAETTIGGIARGITNAIAWVWDTMIGFIAAPPATIVTMFVFGGIGAVLAWWMRRRRSGRHLRHHRHRQRRSPVGHGPLTAEHGPPGPEAGHSSPSVPSSQEPEA